MVERTLGDLRKAGLELPGESGAKPAEPAAT